MQYKTISLHLLEQRPEIQDRLRRQRMLLPTVELLATELKTSHEAWKEALSQSSPDQDESRLASEALELALADLEAYLQTAFPPDETETPDGT